MVQEPVFDEVPGSERWYPPVTMFYRSVCWVCRQKFTAAKGAGRCSCGWVRCPKCKVCMDPKTVAKLAPLDGKRAWICPKLHPYPGYALAQRRQLEGYAEQTREQSLRPDEPSWVGRTVRHKDFGTGTIVRVRGPDLFIDFPGYGEKWFEREDFGRWIEWVDAPD